MKNIIFDIGMVLVDFHWRTTMQKLGIPENVIDTLDHNMVNHPLWNHFDLDDIPEAELIQKFKELSPECNEYIDLFMNNLDDVVDMFPDADKWLKSLKDRGYHIYLLSNYPRRLFALHTPRFHFLPYTDGRVVSYECHITKPDERIYQSLCSKYNLIPDESIFLDDRQANLDAAEKLGFNTLLVTDPIAVRAELENILEKENI